MQGWERAINTLSVRRPQPHNTNPQNERRERQNSRIQKVSEQQANKKALALLMKPASPTPSNTGSLRSFHRDTDQQSYQFGADRDVIAMLSVIVNIHANDSLFGISCDLYSLKSLYMTRCTMTKCCLSYMYIYYLLFSVTVRDQLCMNFTISPFDERLFPYFMYHACLFSEKSV